MSSLLSIRIDNGKRYQILPMLNKRGCCEFVLCQPLGASIPVLSHICQQPLSVPVHPWAGPCLRGLVLSSVYVILPGFSFASGLFYSTSGFLVAVNSERNDKLILSHKVIFKKKSNFNPFIFMLTPCSTLYSMYCTVYTFTFSVFITK